MVEGEAVVDACWQHEEVVLRYFNPIDIIREGGRRRKGRMRSKEDGRERKSRRRRKIVVEVGKPEPSKMNRISSSSRRCLNITPSALDGGDEKLGM